MKNIHILPTDKPSRLLYFGTSKELTLQVNPATFRTFERNTQHLYITSDEEIKEDDYMYDIDGDVGKAIGSDMKEFEGNKKIILTTDQELIKDGVQAIDDEFLEWFVKNPSCEEVETKLVEFEVDMGLGYSCIKYGSYYKIITLKEEQKQHLIDIMRGDEELGLYEEPKQIKCYCGHTITCDCGPLEEPKQENCCTPLGQIKRYVDCYGCDRKPKQETLEEAALNYSKQFLSTQEYDFKEGAKWQAQRMYSEEEVKEILHKIVFDVVHKKEWFGTEEWFEQFKKK